MPKPPQQFKDPSDYSPEEHLEAMRAERRGESFKVETAEFTEYRNDVLRAGGIEPDAPDLDDLDPADMLPEEHLAQIRRASR